MSQTTARAADGPWTDPPPEPSDVGGVAGFATTLRALKAWGGNPSLQVLSRRSGVPRSTLGDALDPERRALPRLDVVTALIAACGLPPALVPRWQRVWKEIQQADEALAAGPRPGARTFLPGHIADFTGRHRETAAVLDALRGPSRVVTISAIDGMAGIGKTTLAVHAAYQLAADHPDGQLFVDLHGHTPGREPLAPDVALLRLLTQLGVDPSRIPRHLDDRAALWRAETTARDVVVLLDNVGSVEQVRPLLPGGRGPVLITSRRRLVGLDGAEILSMGVMTVDDAAELFARVAGPDRATAAADDVARAVALCGRLPLAVRIAATRLRHRPAWSVADLVARLRDERSGAHHPVAAAFRVSFQQLEAPAQTVFRRLGLHPGPDFDVAAAAALAAMPATEVDPILEELLDSHLLEQHTVGRYTFHDLLRAFAADLAATEETPPDRARATARMVGYYLHSAHRAGLRSYATHPSWPHLDAARDLARAGDDVAVADFATRSEALAWYRVEHPVLLAVTARAAAEGLDTHAWQLTGTTASYLLQAGQWRDLLASAETALAASVRAADLRGQGHARHWLGQLLRSEDDRPPAHRHFAAALDIFEALDVPVMVGHVLLDIALTYGEQDRLTEAVDFSRAGLDRFRAIDNRPGEARALNSLGWYLCQLGRYDEAADQCTSALELARAAGDIHAEASVLDSLGYIHHLTGDHPKALRFYQESLHARRAKGDYFLQADVLTKLGDTHLAMGDAATARELWEDASAILIGLRHRDAALVRTRLAGLPDRERAGHCPP